MTGILTIETTNSGVFMSGVLAELGFRERRAIRRIFETRTFEPGEELMTQGTEGAEFMMVFSGSADITVDGERVDTAEPGEFFGELALLPEISGSGGRRLASVVATEPSEVGVCGRVSFTHLLDKHTQFGGHVIAQAWALTGWVADRRRSEQS